MTEPAATSMRALFVEDDEYLREVIAELLAEEGLEVEACATAEAAHARFMATRGFDLLITDVSLPGMSGTELARQLLAIEPKLWVVFSSGYPMNRGLEQFGSTVRSLSKPFEIEALQKLLAEISAGR